MDNIEHEWIETADENEWRAGALQSNDCDELLVPIPEWKRKVIVKQLSGTKRFEYISWQIKLNEFYKDKERDGAYFKRLYFELARLGCVHPKTKKPVFQLADQDTLCNEHNGAVIEMLGRTVQEFSNLDASVGDRVKKNLLSIQNSIATTKSLNGVATSMSAT